MRFPHAKVIEDIAFFTEMRMRFVPSMGFKVEKRNPANGSKEALDFDSTSTHISFLWLLRAMGNIKIGCWDVTKVHVIVDGLLDFHFYDYQF